MGKRAAVLATFGVLAACSDSRPKPKPAPLDANAACATDHAPACRPGAELGLRNGKVALEYLPHQVCSADGSALIYCEDADGDGCLDAIAARCGSAVGCALHGGHPACGELSTPDGSDAPWFGALPPGGAVPADVVKLRDLDAFPVRDEVLVVVLHGRNLRDDVAVTARVTADGRTGESTLRWSEAVDGGDGFLYLSLRVPVPASGPTATLEASFTTRGITIGGTPLELPVTAR